MNRKELYAKVKELNLQEEIKNKYGDNYTRVGNTELEAFIAKHTTKPSKSSSPNKSEATKKATDSCSKCKCDKLTEVLKKKHILLDSEVAYINS